MTEREEIEVLRAALTIIKERADQGGRRIETAMPACDDIVAWATEALASKPQPPAFVRRMLSGRHGS